MQKSGNTQKCRFMVFGATMHRRRVPRFLHDQPLNRSSWAQSRFGTYGVHDSVERDFDFLGQGDDCSQLES